MSRYLLVALGGACGSCARFFVTGLLQGRMGVGFPWGTLAVNVVGCLLIGGLYALAETHALLRPDARALLITGLIGGFTTFSAFGAETSDLLHRHEPGLALANVGANVILGLIAVELGRAGIKALQ